MSKATNRFHGVQRKTGAKREKPFEAWFKADGKQISLGCYEKESNAAWGADYARYLMWGCNPLRDWPADAEPNFFPARNPAGSPAMIERIVYRNCLITHEKMQSRRAEYERECGPVWWRATELDPMRERWNETGQRKNVSSV